VREFGLADGLRGVEGVKRHRSVVRDPRGRIWFSMNRGISVVDPSRLRGSAAPAIAHIESISVDGREMPGGAPFIVPAGRHRVEFSFAGLSLSYPERVRFRYMVDGFDSGWSETVAERKATYTNLGPRSYRFRLAARNPDGAWSGQDAVFEFRVDAQPWQTWWFWFGMALAGAAAAWGLYRWRLKQATGRLRDRFEERLAERTRIAQELHDTLLQGFLSASMQLHVAFDQMPPESPSKPPVNRILNLMARVIEEGRNAVTGLRQAGVGGATDLGQAFSVVGQEHAVNEEIGFRVVMTGGTRPLHPLVRDEVYRIGREAIVNAFRHSGASDIEAGVEYSARQLRVIVRDNGVGIDANVLQAGRDGHWGLPGMRERAERIGARLHLRSSATAGTEVELSVPGHIAFRTEPAAKTTKTQEEDNDERAGLHSDYKRR